MSKTTRTVLVVVGVVLAVCCLGAAGGGFWLYRTYQGAAGPARSAATAYVDDLKAGNYQSAYERQCRDSRAAQTAEQFARAQSAQPKITAYKVQGVSVANNNGRVSADVTFRMTRDGGTQVTQDIALLKEDDEWRVCQ